MPGPFGVCLGQGSHDRSMRRLDEAERSARAVFAAAFRLMDTPETGG